MRLPLTQSVPYPDFRRPLGFLVTIILGGNSWILIIILWLNPKLFHFPITPLKRHFSAPFNVAPRHIYSHALFSISIKKAQKYFACFSILQKKKKHFHKNKIAYIFGLYNRFIKPIKTRPKLNAHWVDIQIFKIIKPSTLSFKIKKCFSHVWGQWTYSKPLPGTIKTKTHFLNFQQK
jgi:hypothetical protein